MSWTLQRVNADRLERAIAHGVLRDSPLGAVRAALQDEGLRVKLPAYAPLVMFGHLNVLWAVAPEFREDHFRRLWRMVWKQVSMFMSADHWRDRIQLVGAPAEQAIWLTSGLEGTPSASVIAMRVLAAASTLRGATLALDGSRISATLCLNGRIYGVTRRGFHHGGDGVHPHGGFLPTAAKQVALGAPPVEVDCPAAQVILNTDNRASTAQLLRAACAHPAGLRGALTRALDLVAEPDLLMDDALDLIRPPAPAEPRWGLGGADLARDKINKRRRVGQARAYL